MSSGHTESFRSHSNYVRAFAMLCETPYQTGIVRPFASLLSTLDRLAPSIASAPSMAPPTSASPDIDQVHGSLTNAWGTELLLAFSQTVASDEQLVRLMNNWGAVQAYYAAYHVTQALIVARGQPRPQSHPKTQAQFVSLWPKRKMQLPPWSLAACDGGWLNSPTQGIDDRLSPWTGCDPHTCWNLAGLALRTTRDEKVDEAMRTARDRARGANRKAWEAEERLRVASGRRPRNEPTHSRPRLTAGQKTSIAAAVRPFSMLDYLYRLRVKTNYEDAGMFIDGPEDQHASRRVHADLITIVSSTTFAHELHVGAVVGKARMMTWVDSWLSRHAVGGGVGLGLRRDLLGAYLA